MKTKTSSAESSIINIGIPIDIQRLLDTRLLIQAGSGGGKSYLLRKLIESIGNRVQQIILDPEGEFVTLREKFDFVLIGKTGDIPLSLKYAEMLAHKLLENNLSAIIDLYELKHHERIIFVKRFLDAIINAPKELWHSCFIHVDEAHIFCPESSKSESASAVIDLCTRGRKRGFSGILATQRLSKLNKDAAAECMNKMIGTTGLDIDRKRAGEELGMTRKEDILKLRELQPGEFYGFGPAITNDVTKFKVLPVITTHLQSGKRIVSNPPAPNAIKKILSKLQDIPEEAEKELQTKQQLQSEVSRLRNELSKSSKNIVAASQIEVQEMKDAIKQRDQAIKAMKTDIGKLTYIIKKMETAANSAVECLRKVEVPSGIIFQNNTGTFNTPTTLKQSTSILVANKTVANSNKWGTGQPKKEQSLDLEKSLPVGERKILTACAQFPNGLRRNQLTVILGYKRSSRDAYIQRLKEKNMIQQSGDKITATELGLSTLGSNFEPLPTGVDLQEYWLNNLPQGEKLILEILIAEYPHGVNRETISEKSGYMRSSRDAYIQRMASKEIIDIVGKGEVKASDELFE